jgi:hypothetical protein
MGARGAGRARRMGAPPQRRQHFERPGELERVGRQEDVAAERLAGAQSRTRGWIWGFRVHYISGGRGGDFGVVGAMKVFAPLGQMLALIFSPRAGRPT